jgi:sialidase-1
MKPPHLLVTALLFTFTLVSPSSAEPSRLVCSGADAGGYAAFPDVCRLQNGEILSVFYSGYGHVSLPQTEWPKGGRIMAARSNDEGKTWSAPTVIIDTTRDDRDPSVVQLTDGSLLCNWFTYEGEHSGPGGIHVLLARSTDGGVTWDAPYPLQLDTPYWMACSSPIRQLPDGSLILGLYHESVDGKTAFGSTVKSYDGGKTWTDFRTIDENSGVRLDAETDVIQLKDGTLFAALRGSQVNMHFSSSPDMGKTWTPVKDIGFRGHCPYLLRHSSGIILLGLRLPGTSVYWSSDETKTWQGPLQVDTRIGAYPSLLESKEGSVLMVYYEEGAGSGIRCASLKVENGQVRLITN